MSTDQTEAAEKSARLNKVVTIAAIFGIIPGLLGGLVAGGILGSLETLIWSLFGGAAGGSAAALLVILGLGSNRKLPLWLFPIVGLVGGGIGQVILLQGMEWIELFGRWISRYGYGSD
jgi:hypothetical protein